ncbi:MAG: Ppx/GppA family phosphatase [Clostridia bacterium]|nr:Ppx/GppA family phosphatase [Clostridia bacterium]
MKAAVIGIGSNSVRMLVAEIQGNLGFRIRRERVATRLFAGLDAERRLRPEAMEATAAAVAEMARHARELPAASLDLFATSATRDASNAEAFAALLRERAGLEPEICSGSEEAALSYLGAAFPGACGVLDIGGGSTEVVTGADGVPAWSRSFQLGAVRLQRQSPASGPESIPHLRAMAGRLLREGLRELDPAQIPPRWVGTGGTFTVLSACYHSAAWTDRTRMHGTSLSKVWVEAEAQRLAALSIPERQALPTIQPGRADIVVHGICILLACMDCLGLSEITVSDYGNLEGYLKRRYRLAALIQLPGSPA